MDSWSEGKLKSYNRNDLAVGRLSKPVPKEYSFSQANLPKESEEFGKAVQAVGYGLTIEPREEKPFEDGTKVTAADFSRDPRKYVGNRTNGEVRVPFENDPWVQNNPALKGRMHFVLPGDSGGPLMAKGDDGRPVIFAVNAMKNYKGWNEQRWRQSVAVSTRYHRDWILETMTELSGLDTKATVSK